MLTCIKRHKSYLSVIYIHEYANKKIQFSILDTSYYFIIHVTRMNHLLLFTSGDTISRKHLLKQLRRQRVRLDKRRQQIHDSRTTERSFALTQ